MCQSPRNQASTQSTRPELNYFLDTENLNFVDDILSSSQLENISNENLPLVLHDMIHHPLKMNENENITRNKNENENEYIIENENENENGKEYKNGFIQNSHNNMMILNGNVVDFDTNYTNENEFSKNSQNNISNENEFSKNSQNNISNDNVDDIDKNCNNTMNNTIDVVDLDVHLKNDCDNKFKNVNPTNNLHSNNDFGFSLNFSQSGYVGDIDIDFNSDKSCSQSGYVGDIDIDFNSDKS
eukprot:Awhi_evm2s327